MSKIRYFRSAIFVLGFVWNFIIQAPAFAETWYEVKSDNFLIYSNAEPEHVEGLIHDLEIFRTYLMKVTNVNQDYVKAIKEARAEKPFLVYGLKNNAYFKSLTGQNNISLSFSHPRGIVTYIDFGFHPDPFEGKRGKPGRQMLFYEYTRYFLKQYSTFNYPLWYSRGLAMYLSTFEFRDGVASIGLPHLRAVRILASAMSHHLLPLRYVLGSTREYYSAIVNRGGFVDLGLFEHNHSEFLNPTTSISLLGYQAWGVVHYLLSAPEYSRDLVEYLVKIDAGEPFEEAFEAVFGETLEVMSEKVYDYTERKLFKSYQIEFSGEGLTAEVVLRKLDSSEANFVKASAKSYFLDQKQRLFTFKNQLEAIQSPEFRLEAKTILAEIKFFTKDHEKAEEIINGVLAESPDAGRANGVMGALLVEKGSVQEARKYLRKAIRQNENDLVALYYLGHTYLNDLDGNLAEGIAVLNRAFMIYPQNEKLRFELATLNALAGNADFAIPELRTLANWGSGEAIRAAAKGCLARIQQNQACDAHQINTLQNP